MTTIVLPAALAELKEQHRWVYWKYERSRTGKPTKVPYQPSGARASTDDASTWSAFDAVAAVADGFDGIGFILTDSNIAAFDLDKCRDPATGDVDDWAQALVDRANSYSEVTPSGTGLRIIGRGDGDGIHRKLRVGTNGASCEVYRKATRYITVTGSVHRDSGLANIDAVIDAVITELGGEQSENTCENTRGTTDLPPMLESLLSIVGSGGYPSRSELFFAFITSARRARVSNDAIINACLDSAHDGCGIHEHCRENGGSAYVERQLARARTQVGDAPDAVIDEINKHHALVLAGDKAAVMKMESKTKFRLLKTAAFKQWYANQRVVVGDKSVAVGDHWLRHPRRRQFEGIEFAPSGGRPGYYNMWQSFAVEPREGDCSKFLAHLRDNVCSDDPALYNWVIGWFAHVFQHPEEKLDTALVLRGKMGVGKTKVGQVVGSLLGDHYALVSDPRYVTGQFNSHMASLLLLHADEAFWAGDKRGEGKLKDLVSGKQHFIEFKGIDPVLVKNLMRLFVTGNREWLVPAGFEERRFAALDVLDAHMQDYPYFAAIDAEMDNGGREALLHYLLNFDLSRINLREIPRTAALLEQQIETATPEQAWWLDTLKNGKLPGKMSDQNACRCNALYNHYIAHAQQQGARRRAIEVRIGAFLRKHVGEDVERKRITLQRVIARQEQPMERRFWCYTLPSLAECRERFANHLQQEIEWEDDDAEWEDDDAEWWEDDDRM
jgi:hypothetical protein